ncbi:MAG TPA: aldolase/citrate lyase family protein [Planctomycetaceae bacterium]|jgi:2-dehydro-3-deoxyglucarate aldolase/4-hydroxy-2-oxoheptanedioate aldolase
MMRTNPVKRALAAGKMVLGSEISRIRSADIPRLYSAAGFDFVFIDTEHSSLNLETVADMIAVARSAGIVPIVRVTQAEYALVARMLDQGAQGIIVPRVNTAQEVRDIVSWMRYPPEGIRGFADTAAQTDFQPVSIGDFIETGNRETLCVIQIERREAVENLDEMLSVPGVDVACLGCMDLSVDLGVPGQIDHPAMVDAIGQVVSAGRRHGVATGIISANFEVVAHWMQAGIRFVSYSGESLLLKDGAQAAVERLREVTKAAN